MIDLALRDRLDRYEDALQSIVQWSEAYPLDIFPEPDWKAARKLLEAGGISLDSIMRREAVLQRTSQPHRKVLGSCSHRRGP